MGKNLYEKVFEKHNVGQLPSGQSQLFIGLHMIHEVTSPQAFAMIRESGLSVPSKLYGGLFAAKYVMLLGSTEPAPTPPKVPTLLS